MTDASLTACCQSRRYMDPLPCDGVEFAKVARCLACNAFKGPVRINYTAPKALAAAWTGTAEAMMVDHFARRMGPMKFTMREGYIVPEGYQGQLKVQAELEQPPF